MPVSPARALRQAIAHGRELPPVPALSGLAGWGVTFRHGQLVMVTGRPKAGKSNLTQWLVSQWRDERALYNCWDMPAMTAVSRQAAVVTGHRVSDILRAFDNDSPEAGYYEEQLADGNVEFCFDRKPGLPDVQQEVDAWVEKYDAYPGVIVCDNLLNIDGAEEDHRAQKFILRELQVLAAQTEALVIVLHHATEGTKDTSRPPAARETDGKVNQIPDLVLSVANDGNGGFSLAPVANRNGPSDPNADNPIRIWCDFARMQFAAHPPITTTSWSPYE